MLQKKKRKPANGTVIWLLGVATLAALVLAQVELVEQPPVVLEPAAQSDGSAAAAGGDELDGGAIQSLSFKEGTTIRAALKMLALKYQKNIVPTPRVEGQITVTELFNVTFGEALQAVIGTNKYDVQGNFIMVFTPDEYEQIKADKRRMEDRCFPLYYITADEAQKLVTPLLSPDGATAISSPAQTGVPAGESITSDSAGGDNLAFQDTMVIRDYPENIARVTQLIKKLDVRPKQVLVEATILSATLTEQMQFGIDWSFAAGVSLTSINQLGQGGITAGTPIEIGGFANTGSGLRIGVTAGDVAVLITALEQITDTTILANPKILAVNKQLGQVYIGTKIGYREGDVVTDGGATQQGAVKFLDTGTKLAFRPYIGDDGYIRMQIHPKDSTGDLNPQGVPNETSSELATNVIIRDGQTIIIGGLFREKVNSVKSQVPLLGSLPLIGDAFKNIDDTSRREEVIVMLTPHIIDSPDQIAGNEKNLDPMKMLHQARKRINWMSTARQADDVYEKAATFYANGDTCAAMRELNWALHLRPTFIEAVRLRERIVRETGDDGGHHIENIMLDVIRREKVVWFD
jgi:type IV pilus assembly protein PilQ